MKENVRFLGLDVHAETIAVAIAEPDGSVRSLGTIANRAESIRKMVKKLGPVEHLKACYKAGPTGYALYWQLAELGVACDVIAPTLVPMKAGNRVKTDRRDAERLARSFRSGDLTAVWVPDAGSEALRDLVRAREAAKQDQLRARHRLSKFLLRSGQRPAQGMKAWTLGYMAWVRQIRFKQLAQESTRLDYLHEVEHMAERVKRLEQAITEAVKQTSPEIQEVTKAPTRRSSKSTSSASRRSTRNCLARRKRSRNSSMLRPRNFQPQKPFRSIRKSRATTKLLAPRPSKINPQPRVSSKSPSANPLKWRQFKLPASRDGKQPIGDGKRPITDICWEGPLRTPCGVALGICSKAQKM